MSTPQEIIAQLKRTEQSEHALRPSHPRPRNIPEEAVFLFSERFDTGSHFQGHALYDVYKLGNYYYASRKLSEAIIAQLQREESEVEDVSAWAGEIDKAVPYLEILAEIDKRS